LECICCLTQLSGGDIYYLLHREQLHVSASGNGHLQAVYETLSKELYKTYIWGREAVSKFVAAHLDTG